MQTFRRITAPAFPAVSTSQLREWLRLDDDVDQDTLDLLLGSAVDHVESITGQTVVSAVYQTVITDPGCYLLPINNVTAVSVQDSDGNPVAIEIAEASIHAARAVVDVGSAIDGPIIVQITAGWTSEDEVPAALRHAVAVYVGAAYDTRNDISDATFRTIANLVRPYWRPVV